MNNENPKLLTKENEKVKIKMNNKNPNVYNRK